MGMGRIICGRELASGGRGQQVRSGEKLLTVKSTYTPAESTYMPPLFY